MSNLNRRSTYSSSRSSGSIGGPYGLFITNANASRYDNAWGTNTTSLMYGNTSFIDYSTKFKSVEQSGIFSSVSLNLSLGILILNGGIAGNSKTYDIVVGDSWLTFCNSLTNYLHNYNYTDHPDEWKLKTYVYNIDTGAQVINNGYLGSLFYSPTGELYGSVITNSPSEAHTIWDDYNEEYKTYYKFYQDLTLCKLNVTGSDILVSDVLFSNYSLREFLGSKVDIYEETDYGDTIVSDYYYSDPEKSVVSNMTFIGDEIYLSIKSTDLNTAANDGWNTKISGLYRINDLKIDISTKEIGLATDISMPSRYDYDIIIK